jgi:hypothetical protein
MRGAVLDRAPRQKAAGVAPGKDQLRPALQQQKGDEGQGGQVGVHAQATAIGKTESVKPGPSAIAISFGGGSVRSTAARTNSTVGADMLP